MKRILLWGTLLILGVLFITRGPQELDDAGWIPHKRHTPIMLNGDWMPGEERICEAYASNITRPKVDVLSCVEGNPDVSAVTRRSFYIKYWRRVERRNVFTGFQQLKWQWRCLRQSEQVTCWAIN
jgi:hypothetical protein